jgi:hypothetical protein
MLTFFRPPCNLVGGTLSDGSVSTVAKLSTIRARQRASERRGLEVANALCLQAGVATKFLVAQLIEEFEEKERRLRG